MSLLWHEGVLAIERILPPCALSARRKVLLLLGSWIHALQSVVGHFHCLGPSDVCSASWWSAREIPVQLTHKYVCDKSVVALLRSRTLGNSRTAIRNTLHELHNEELMRDTDRLWKQFIFLFSSTGNLLFLSPFQSHSGFWLPTSEMCCRGWTAC